jgi:hypothetical protein
MISIIIIVISSDLTLIMVYIILMLTVLRYAPVSAGKSLFPNCGLNILGNGAASINNIHYQLFKNIAATFLDRILIFLSE